MNDRPSRPDAELKLRLEAFLPYRLSVLANTIGDGIAALYRPRFDLTVAQWRVMAVLGRLEGLSARAVAERTAMDKVAVSRALKRLEDAGYLERTTHTADRRLSVLALSLSGREVYQQVVPLAMEYERKLLDGITPQERATLDDLLERLLRRARTLE